MNEHKSKHVQSTLHQGPPNAPAVHDEAPFAPAGQGITWPLGWYWYWEESFRSFSRWICPRSDKACCPATPGSHPANCLKTCTLEIVWSKSKYTCFTNASGLTALATGTFGSTAMFSAAFAIFGVAAVLQTPLKPSGGGGGATLPLAAAWQMPLKPVGGGGGTGGTSSCTRGCRGGAISPCWAGGGHAIWLNRCNKSLRAWLYSTNSSLLLCLHYLCT